MKGANVMKLSIVIPVYFNHDNLLPLYNDLREKVLCKLDCDYEILMVDDGSKDKSYDVICELARLDTHIIPLKCCHSCRTLPLQWRLCCPQSCRLTGTVRINLKYVRKIQGW